MGRLVEPGVDAAASTGSGSREPRRPAGGGLGTDSASRPSSRQPARKSCPTAPPIAARRWAACRRSRSRRRGQSVSPPPPVSREAHPWSVPRAMLVTAAAAGVVRQVRRPTGGPPCSSSGSSTASGATWPIWSTPCRTCRRGVCLRVLVDTTSRGRPTRVRHLRGASRVRAGADPRPRPRRRGRVPPLWIAGYYNRSSLRTKEPMCAARPSCCRRS